MVQCSINVKSCVAVQQKLGWPQRAAPGGGGGDGGAHQRRQAVPSAISTSSAAAVVPPGLVTLARSCAGVSGGGFGERAGAGDGSTRQRQRQLRRQALGLAGRRQRLDQQEDVGRAGAGDAR